jgi:predicted MPP superfamily phosphohydrolase
MGKILAIGDIHTKIWIIEKVARIINDYDKVIFCGDFADDFNAGPQDTLNTWSYMKGLQIKNRSKVELVMGNHDYIYVNNTPSSQSGYNPMTHVLIDAPENKNLKEWLTDLPVIIEIDGVTYSHAGIASEWSGAEDVTGLWDDTSPLWARPGGSITYKIYLKYSGTPLPILVMKSNMGCGVSIRSLQCQTATLSAIDRCCKLLMAKDSLNYI